MSDLLKVKVGGSSYLCKWTDPRYVEIGGRDYTIVKIGSQLWTGENLDYKFDGLNIGTSYSGQIKAIYRDDSEATYGLDGTYKCGLMYTWYAAKYLDNNKATLLPSGWHVPTQDEWDTLISAVGSNPGTKLKALDKTVTSNWPSGWNGTDSYGFNALPGGSTNGTNFGIAASFQCSSQFTDTKSPVYDMNTGNSFTRFSNGKDNCLYVRLVKNLT